MRDYMRCPLTFVAAGLSILTALPVFAQPAGGESHCAQMATLELPGLSLEITKTQWLPAGKTPPTAPGAPP